MAIIDKGILIDVKDLTWGYPENPNLTFNKLNLNLYENDFLVIMGKAGVGKSTLAKLLIGELHAPVKSIFHKKDDITTYDDDAMQIYRRKIGMIFQDYKLVDELSVKENVIYPLNIYGLDELTMDSKYSNIKDKLGLKKITNTPVKFLSAGEKQKVCMARALISEPEFIIADEPTGNLDREHTQQIAQMLIDSNKSGNTVLLITHDIHLVNYLKEKHNIKMHIMS